MIFKWIIYCLTYFAGWVFASLLLFRISELFVVKFLKSDIRDIKQYNKWWNIALRYFVVLLFPVFYIVLSMFNYYPPEIYSEIFSETDSSKKIQLISDEVERIEQMLGNIENLTINEISVELDRTLTFSKQLKEEATYNQKLITDLVAKAEKERRKLSTVEERAEQIELLTEKQIRAVQHMITNEAYHQNKKSFWIGSIVSFFIGILASYIATILFSKYNQIENG